MTTLRISKDKENNMNEVQKKHAAGLILNRVMELQTEIAKEQQNRAAMQPNSIEHKLSIAKYEGMATEYRALMNMANETVKSIH